MKGRNLLRLVILVCCGAVAAFLASGAAAMPPDTLHIKDSGAGVFDFPAGSVCSFEVSFNFVKDQGERIVYPNGVRKTTGITVFYVTNVDTGETRRFVEAGYVLHRTLSSDTVTTETVGTELSLFFPGDLGPGSPGSLPFITGRSIEVDQIPGPNPNPFGVTTLSFQVLSGTVEDLCVTMA